MGIYVIFVANVVLYTVSVCHVKLRRLFSPESTDGQTQRQKKKLHGFQSRRSFFLFTHHNERTRYIQLKKKLSKIEIPKKKYSVFRYLMLIKHFTFKDAMR